MLPSPDNEVLSLAQAAARVAALRGGRPPHVNTVRSWARHGLRGFRLESFLVGGRRFTTTAALQHFLDQLNPLVAVPVPSDEWRHSE